MPDATDQRPPVAVGHVRLNVVDVGAAARWLETVGLRLATNDSELKFVDQPSLPFGTTASFLVALAGVSKSGSTGDLILAESTAATWDVPVALGSSVTASPISTIPARLKASLNSLGVSVRKP